MSSENKTIRVDGWSNVFKGLGGRADTGEKVTFGEFRVIPDYELAAMYAGDGWVKKLINAPADDMTRAWISIEEDKNSVILKKLKTLRTKNAFNTALKWQRLFRGGLIWMVSSRAKDMPYTPGEKINILKLKTFSASEVRIKEWHIDAKHPENYGDPKLFTIRPSGRRTEEFTIHASQCLILKGDPIPDTEDGTFTSLFTASGISAEEYLYWGTGVVQSIFPQLSRYGSFEQGMGSLGQELIVAIYKIAGLREILQDDQGSEMMAQRMEMMNNAKSILNAIFLDAEGGEEFSRNTPNLAGVGDLWDKFMMTMSGCSNIPSSRFFGRQAAGLNNKGEMDERNYNAYLTGQQELNMEVNLQILLSHLEGREIAFTFKNPWEPSQLELVDMRKKQSDIDKTYVVDIGAITPEEVRINRFKGNFSFDTDLINGVFDPSTTGKEPEPVPGEEVDPVEDPDFTEE